MEAENIDAMLADGVPFDTIEDRIERADLPSPVKSLMWLYLWVQADVEDRRRVLRQMVAASA